jgi:hypothetical protein
MRSGGASNQSLKARLLANNGIAIYNGNMEVDFY